MVTQQCSLHIGNHCRLDEVDCVEFFKGVSVAQLGRELPLENVAPDRGKA